MFKLNNRHFIGKMSFGRSVKRFANDFSRSLKLYKLTRGIKPVCGIVLDTSTCKDVSLLTQQLKSFSFTKYQAKELDFNFPQVNEDLKKNIIEPDNSIKISFKLPIRKFKNTAFDLPSPTEKEISEPGEITSKSAASHMIRIRKRKMKKHKIRKYRKKNWAEIKKLKIQRTQEKEALFNKSLREVWEEMETFSADKYVDKMLEEAHWEKPITRLKGMLAPKWVIEQHLKEKEYEKIIEERIKECQK